MPPNYRYFLAISLTLAFLAMVVNVQILTDISQELARSNQHWKLAKEIHSELPIPHQLAALKMVTTDYYHILNNEEWQSTFTPSGAPFGFVRLGEDAAPLEPAIFHQMHCLDTLRKSILFFDWRNISAYERQLWHVNHCMNMLRQAILCNSDITLEPSFVYGIYDGRNQSAASGMDVWHVCRDWTQVNKFVGDNFAQTRNITK
ncbi:hypothetical protein D9757_012957 [Collybiopsis confluens]|uniref:Oxidase ustYa n=1 Tax=Collybiopsis confluens TaxID=2823264 RepID=A0A8H5G579_9AGAR|nr:hypothetical protein D9757_012957 [Collybiopsis confluens]